jgi:hypothetical protein
MIYQGLIAGIIFILMGAVCFTPFLFSDVSNLIIKDSNFFIVKNFIPILFVNAGLCLITVGILFIKKDLIPAIATDNKVEKIKTRLLGTVLLMPSLLLANLVFIELSDTKIWKVICIVFTLGIIASVYIDYKSWREQKNIKISLR